MDEIKRLQEILLLIRRSVGWTAEEFGNRIGVTRQTINNLESGRNRLTKTQYIAMRSVLDAEIARYPEETGMLRFLLDAAVDHPESYSEQERDILLGKAQLLAPAILAGASGRKEVSDEWMAAVTGLGVITKARAASLSAAASYAEGSWLSRTLHDEERKTPFTVITNPKEAVKPSKNTGSAARMENPKAAREGRIDDDDLDAVAGGIQNSAGTNEWVEKKEEPQ